MNSRIITKYLITCLLCSGTAAAITACSDWTDHYDANTQLLYTQQQTLWQNIQQDNNLTEFASLLKKTGYDAVLNNSQTFTVWAPVNGSFDFDVVNALSNERVEKEFIQNHIARNNYPASGQIAQRIFTLNEKLMHFSGSGNYTMQGVPIAKPNFASENGTIHTITGKLPFIQNIYESLNNYEYPLDSISNYFHSYDVKKLNEQKSVVGPTVNGEITYLDSIFDEHNDLFTLYSSYINREDSNYTMIVPTNEAWNKAKALISKYFQYRPSFEFMENTSTTDKKKTTIKIRDVQYLQDSIVNFMLTSYLFYNNNIYDNKKLVGLQTSERLNCDSLCSTREKIVNNNRVPELKIYSEDAAALFEGAQRVNKSNGAIWVTDSIRMHPWSAWNPEIRVEAENMNMLSSTLNVAGEPEIVYIAPGMQNPEVEGVVSNNRYVEITPMSASVNPGVVYYLPDVRSATYAIYLVVVPSNIQASGRELKPNRFSVSMGYADQTGTNIDGEKSWTAASIYSNDSANVDTVYLGDFTFPMAYAGTGNYYPYLRINSSVSNRERDSYDRVLRFDCIILRPKELDNYLKEHPDYKYDLGIY